MRNRTRVTTSLLAAMVVLAAWSSLGSANSVVYHGRTHTSIGAATLAVINDSLVVSGLGVGGTDGVSVATAGSLSQLQELSVVSPTLIRGAATGRFIASTARGTVNGVPNSVIAVQKATRSAANNVHNDFDYSALTPTSVDAFAFKNNSLAQKGTFVTSTFTGDESVAGVTTIEFTYSWDPDIDIVITFGAAGNASMTDGSTTLSTTGPGAAGFLFDAHGPKVVSDLSAVELLGGGGLTSFVITNESTKSSPLSTVVPALSGWLAMVSALVLLVAGASVLWMYGRNSKGGPLTA